MPALLFLTSLLCCAAFADEIIIPDGTATSYDWTQTGDWCFTLHVTDANGAESGPSNIRCKTQPELLTWIPPTTNVDGTPVAGLASYRLVALQDIPGPAFSTPVQNLTPGTWTVTEVGPSMVAVVQTSAQISSGTAVTMTGVVAGNALVATLVQDGSTTRDWQVSDDKSGTWLETEPAIYGATNRAVWAGYSLDHPGGDVVVTVETEAFGEQGIYYVMEVSGVEELDVNFTSGVSEVNDTTPDPLGAGVAVAADSISFLVLANNAGASPHTFQEAGWVEVEDSDKRFIGYRINATAVDPQTAEIAQGNRQWVTAFFSLRAAGGGAFTLTAESGSYAIAGTDIDLPVGRNMPADSGSYALSGTDADLIRGVVIEADAGSYALAGTAIELVRSLIMPGDSGAYSLVGSAADLLRGVNLVAESGSYALSGTDADLLRGLVMVGNSGSYVLNGTDVVLTFVGSNTLVAESGTYTLSGTAAALVRGLILAGEAGSYILSGTDVTLTYSPVGSFTLSADSGTYSLTGGQADFLRGLIMSADAGAYTFTGANVDMVRSVLLAAESGSFALSGTDVDLLRGMVLAADSGVYTLSGSNVVLAFSGEVVIGRVPGLVSGTTARGFLSGSLARGFLSSTKSRSILN